MRKVIKRILKPFIEEILSEGIDCHVKARVLTAVGGLSPECTACGKRGSITCKPCGHYESHFSGAVKTVALPKVIDNLEKLQIVKVRVAENGIIYFYCPGDVIFDDPATCDKLLAKGIEIMTYSTIG